MAADNSSFAFTVRVLDGELKTQVFQAGVPAGTIRLAERAQPFRPITYEGTQRVKTRFYPGNPVATQQLIGPTEEPTTIAGEWKDRYLGLGVARQLAAAFDQLRIRGALVEVSWGAGLAPDGAGGDVVTTLPLTRTGIISHVKFTLERTEDVQYEITFAWRGQDVQSVSTITAAAPIITPDGINAAIADMQSSSAIIQAFQQLTASQLFQGPADLLRQVDSQVGQIDEAAAGLNNLLVVVQATAVIPLEVLQRSYGALSLALTSCAQAAVSFCQLPLYILNASDDAANLLDIFVDVFDVLAQMDAGVVQAWNSRDAVQAQLYPPVIAQVRPVPGTSLRALATQFYGDPDLWVAIANYNGIDGSIVPQPPAGPSDDPYPPIGIPRLQASPETDLHQAC